MHILKIKAAYCKRNLPKHIPPPSHTNPDYTPYKYFCPALRLFTIKHMAAFFFKKMSFRKKNYFKLLTIRN